MRFALWPPSSQARPRPKPNRRQHLLFCPNASAKSILIPGAEQKGTGRLEGSGSITVPITRLRRVIYHKENRDPQLACIGWLSSDFLGVPFRFGTSERHPRHVSIGVEFDTKHIAEEYGAVPNIVAEFFVAAAVMWWASYIKNLIPRERSFNLVKTLKCACADRQSPDTTRDGTSDCGEDNESQQVLERASKACGLLFH